MICVFIVKAAYDIFADAIKKMVDHACSQETQQGIVACAGRQEGVLGVSHIQTREFGNRIYVDLEILADGQIPLTEANKIAERVHDRIEQEFPKIKHILVLVRPKE